MRDLESNDGPDSRCIPRYQKWWDQCVKQGVGLEDCTGAFLGTLPLKDLEEEESEDEESEEEQSEYEDAEDGSWKKQITDGGVGDNGVPMSELRALLDECRRMSVSEGDDINFMDMARLQSGV